MRAVAIRGPLGALVLTAGTALGTAVPAGAASGDLPDPFADVRMAVGTEVAAEAAATRGVDWGSCPAAESLPDPVECGKVAVPVDYGRPHAARIELTVSRRRATGPAKHRLGPLLYNPGGPGASGMSFPLLPSGGSSGSSGSAAVWKRLNSAYDLVGYAPRGVGRSAPLHCKDPRKGDTKNEKADGQPHRAPASPSPAFKKAERRRAAAYARGCARAQGHRLDHYTTPDNARDLDVLRAALGANKLNLLGVSYGSYLGAAYATLFPDHVGRLVLDSVVDPRRDRIGYRSVLDQDLAFERRWTDWKRWVARHDSRYGLGRSPRAVQRQVDRARRGADHGRLGGGSLARTVGSREVLTALIDVAYDDRAWPELAAALADFGEGHPDRLAGLASREPQSAAEASSEENADAVYTAVQCSDARWPRTWSRWNRDTTSTARRAPLSTWQNAWTNLPCAYWKGERSRPLEIGAAPGRLPPVLLLAATRDAATPYEGAVRTWRRLPGSSLVTEEGAGSHGVAGGNACADRHLTAYLLHGRTPGRAAHCPARPAPQPDEANSPLGHGS